MAARGLIFASLLAIVVPVSSDEMPRSVVEPSDTSSKAVKSLGLAIVLENRRGDFSGVALVSQ
jgi:hypothetical protein